MALVGYARVSTEDQATARQLDELRAAGCREVAEEHASGGDRNRPVLARTLARLRPGDTLVVVTLDRLARSLSHLLEVVESPAPGPRFMHQRHATWHEPGQNCFVFLWRSQLCPEPCRTPGTSKMKCDKSATGWTFGCAEAVCAWFCNGSMLAVRVGGSAAGVRR